MSPEEGALVPRRSQIPEQHETALVRAEAARAELRLEIGKVVADAVRTGLRVWEEREKTANKWEEVQQKIAVVDKESAAELGRLQKQLSLSEQRTERMRMLLDYAAGLDRDGLQLLSGAIGDAIRQLTKE